MIVTSEFNFCILSVTKRKASRKNLVICELILRAITGCILYKLVQAVKLCDSKVQCLGKSNSFLPSICCNYCCVLTVT